MKKPVAQYAVIEVRRTDGPAERFVLAYSEERSLRDLIAGRNIIACGFTARDEAQAHINAKICEFRGDARQEDPLKSCLRYFGLVRRAAQKALQYPVRYHRSHKLLPELFRRVSAVALFATHP